MSATESQINYAIKKIKKAIPGEANYESDLEHIVFVIQLETEPDDLEDLKNEVTVDFINVLPKTWTISGRSLNKNTLFLNAKLVSDESELSTVELILKN